MKTIITTLALALTMIVCNAQNKLNNSKKLEKMKTELELTNKEKASALITSLETGDKSTIAYISRWRICIYTY